MIHEFISGTDAHQAFFENLLKPRNGAKTEIDTLREPIKAFGTLCDLCGIPNKYFEVNCLADDNKDSRLYSMISAFRKKLTGNLEANEITPNEAPSLIRRSLLDDVPAVLWSHERLPSNTSVPTLNYTVNTVCWHDHALVVFGYIDENFLYYDPADPPQNKLSPTKILGGRTLSDLYIYNFQILKNL
jgi:hypothetical protein